MTPLFKLCRVNNGICLATGRHECIEFSKAWNYVFKWDHKKHSDGKAVLFVNY